MSLISLTFGTEQYPGLNAKGSNTSVTKPNEVNFKGKKGVFEVKKVDKFFGTKEICLMGKLVEGVVGPGMQAEIGDKKIKIETVESKYGERPVHREGTNALIMVGGAEHSDFEGNETIEFKKEYAVKIRKKGKVIIC